MVRRSSTTFFSSLSSSAVQVSGENGMAHAVSRPSSRPFHLSMNAAVRRTASSVACLGRFQGAWISVTHSPMMTRMPESS